MRLSTLAFAFAILGTACGGSPERGDLPSSFPDLAFADLDGVRLGMTARELELVRPNSAFIEYVGRGEQLGERHVGYLFPPTAAMGKGLEERAELRRVSVVQNARSWADAKGRWDDDLRRATSRHGPPTTCERVIGESSGLHATWQLGDVYLVLSVRTPLDAGRELLPDRVVHAVSLEPPSRSNTIEISCAAAAASTDAAP